MQPRGIVIFVARVRDGNFIGARRKDAPAELAYV